MPGAFTLASMAASEVKRLEAEADQLEKQGWTLGEAWVLEAAATRLRQAIKISRENGCQPEKSKEELARKLENEANQLEIQAQEKKSMELEKIRKLKATGSPKEASDLLDSVSKLSEAKKLRVAGMRLEATRARMPVT